MKLLLIIIGEKIGRMNQMIDYLINILLYAIGAGIGLIIYDLIFNKNNNLSI